MLTELESKVPAGDAYELGHMITNALQVAIEEGTPEAIGALTDLLDQANMAIETGSVIVLSTVDKFKISLGDKFADKALQDKVGKNGADLMDALNTAIEMGGAKGAETMAQEAFDIITAMNNALPAGKAKSLGEQLMADLTTALATGGADAIAIVTADLAAINALLTKTPTSATGQGANPKAAPPKTGPQPAPVSSTSLFDMLLQKITSLTGSAAIASLNSMYSKWSTLYSRIIPNLTGSFVNINLSGFHDWLKGQGLAFARGGFVPGPIGAPMLAMVHGGEYVSPPSSPGEMMAPGGRVGHAGVMSMSVQVNAPINLQFQLVDWAEVKACVNEAMDVALGRARSESVRAGVLPKMGVG